MIFPEMSNNLLKIFFRLFMNKSYLNEAGEDDLDEGIDLDALERKAAGNW
jgi:hypothetical protein